MNKKVLALIPLGGALASAFAADGEGAYTASQAATTLATNMTQLTNDVTQTIGPAAIALVVAVAMVVVGRGFIKKFFKA